MDPQSRGNRVTGVDRKFLFLLLGPIFETPFRYGEQLKQWTQTYQ
jgi:hypothetical protein